MNILCLQCASDLYGSSQCLLRLVQRLARNGHRVYIMLPDHGPLESAMVEAGGIVRVDENMPILRRHHFASLVLLCGLLRQMIAFRASCHKYAREVQADLIHTNSSITLGGGGVARRLKIPHITHVRESFAEFSLLWPVLRRYILHVSDRVVCVSDAMALQFAVGGELSDRVLTIYDGFPLAPFDCITSEAMDVARQKYGLTDRDLILVGLVGRIKWKRKGQETFVHAAARLVGKNKNYRFLLVGGVFPGNEKHVDMTIELIQELGVENQVLYLGETYDVYPLVCLFDVAVMASGLPEPFGGVTLEAMALRKPVVGTAIGGTVEQVEDGVTGLLVPPNNPEAMASAIERLLCDPALRQKMGEAGRRRLEKMFLFDLHYDKMLALYRELVKRER